MSPIDAAVTGREFPFSQADFGRVRRMIYERAGISLNPGKRNMVYSRLSRRLRACGATSFEEYLDSLGNPAHPEWEGFTNALTTNLTSFFREAHHFPVLTELLRSGAGRGTQTVWCAAASTGEEPYSIAITACEAFGTLAPPVRILASDVDSSVLATADAGVYELARVEKITPGQLKRYFLRGAGARAGQVRVRPELRRLVTFEQVNLLDRAWPVRSPLDAIFCRNVMIYFDEPEQKRLVDKLYRCLRPGGYLFVGHAETLFGLSDKFRMIHQNNGTAYQRNEVQA